VVGQNGLRNFASNHLTALWRCPRQINQFVGDNDDVENVALHLDIAFATGIVTPDCGHRSRHLTEMFS
jgi:hypothetical protein